jgi:hypothetical protein
MDNFSFLKTELIFLGHLLRHIPVIPVLTGTVLLPIPVKKFSRPMCLFIYGLFNGAVNNRECTVSNGTAIHE